MPQRKKSKGTAGDARSSTKTNVNISQATPPASKDDHDPDIDPDIDRK